MSRCPDRDGDRNKLVLLMGKESGLRGHKVALGLVRLDGHCIERVGRGKGGGGRRVRGVLLVLIIRVRDIVRLYGYRLRGVLELVREEIFHFLLLFLNHDEIL